MNFEAIETARLIGQPVCADDAQDSHNHLRHRELWLYRSSMRRSERHCFGKPLAKHWIVEGIVASGT